MDAAKEAAAQGRTVFVKVGGQVYQVPGSKVNDVAAWVTDLKARFLSSSRKAAGRAHSPVPPSIELSYGTTGIMLNLDRVDFFSPELAEEFGNLQDSEELAADIAGYIAKSADTYLGIETDAVDIRDAWDSEGTTNDEPEEDDEEE